METVFKKSLLVAFITFLLDFLFHYFLTNPMESLTYFVIKFLLAFFVATGMFSLRFYLKRKDKRKLIIPISGLIFSTLMSIYYRAWELGEAKVPFGSRAPDLLGIARETFWFPLSWWLGHALFFMVGVMVANKLIKK